MHSPLQSSLHKTWKEAMDSQHRRALFKVRLRYIHKRRSSMRAHQVHRMYFFLYDVLGSMDGLRIFSNQDF